MSSSLIKTESGPLIQELAFDRSEYLQRLEGARNLMRSRGIDLFISWTPENILYVTGHDTPGYYYYQASIIGHSTEPINVVRQIEASNTWGRSAFRHAAPYQDYEDPISRTLEVIGELGLASSRIGVEKNAWFITPARFEQFEAGIRASGGTVVDGSMLVESLRLTKSPSELKYIRLACNAADMAMAAAIDATREGVNENTVASAVWTSLLEQGSQAAGLPPFVVSGRRTSLCHATWAGHIMEPGDVLVYELPGVFERYVGPIVRTGVIGRPSTELEKQAAINIETTETVIAAMKPGAAGEDIQRLCNDCFIRAGYGALHAFRSAYSIGLNYAPDWGEGHIMSVVEGEQRTLQPNMTFHVIPGLRVAGRYMVMFSESIVITENGAERLTQAPQELFVR